MTTVIKVSENQYQRAKEACTGIKGFKGKDKSQELTFSNNRAALHGTQVITSKGFTIIHIEGFGK